MLLKHKIIINKGKNSWWCSTVYINILLLQTTITSFNLTRIEKCAFFVNKAETKKKEKRPENDHLLWDPIKQY